MPLTNLPNTFLSLTLPTATGPAGPQGATGNNGTNGNTILNGSGAPSNAVGVNGDFYIDALNTVIYGPKAAGVWGSGTSLIGTTSPSVIVTSPSNFTSATTGSPIIAKTGKVSLDTVGDTAIVYVNGITINNIDAQAICNFSIDGVSTLNATLSGFQQVSFKLIVTRTGSSTGRYTFIADYSTYSGGIVTPSTNNVRYGALAGISWATPIDIDFNIEQGTILAGSQISVSDFLITKLKA